MSRVLSLRELNRATLARQLLLERRRLSPLAVIERLAGMQAQWAPAPYVGIWTRVAQFRREALERALLRGDVLKATLMRGTLHLVTAREYGTFFAALRDYLWWADPESGVIGERAAPALRLLYADGAKPWGVARECLEREYGVTEELTRRRAWYVARVRGHVLHAPETALWRVARQTLYRAVPEPEDLDVQTARRELVRHYLAAFGPASRADIAGWSGLRVRDVAPALEALEPLRRFADEGGQELLDLGRAPLPPAQTPAPVRFLPKWDNVLLGFADRRRVLPEEYRKRVIGKNGDVAQTFLIDGFVTGTWRAEKGRVATEPFEPLPRAQRVEVAEEAARLSAWLR